VKVTICFHNKSLLYELFAATDAFFSTQVAFDVLTVWFYVVLAEFTVGTITSIVFNGLLDLV